ncbi:MAG: DNA (cytosine-5-)-methyltransferase [Anaerolineae bacterium]|nr:DNA cytosine methyltransferase [Anaerolineales bacterium]MCQ3976119.1 DNA (cytosine-5-)-methyltransferase [Anaerolineae bacterium]
MENCSVIDMFCGAGGLTHGFVLEGFKVIAGIDADTSCKYAYETNNRGAYFIHKKIEDLIAEEILDLYPHGHTKILVGCAPCQPYSSYNKKKGKKDEKWRLLDEFGDLICEVKPDIVSMENVPDLVKYRKGKVYSDFVAKLKANGYYVSSFPEVYCPDYGIPQQRTRLVMFASKYSEIDILPPTHSPDQYRTVWETIGQMEPIKAGGVSEKDPLHRSSQLSELNMRRIRASKPGGTWRDWDKELIATCHRKVSGDGYVSVYGRMEWHLPSPTITTQFYGFGNGRFGHPEQDRAISLREGALLQTFPMNYEFVAPDKPIHLKVMGRHMGNAVPVELGRVIARSIAQHLRVHLQ